MAVEFLDEVENGAMPPSAGFEFVGEETGAAATAADIKTRLRDPNYLPTLAEFQIYDRAQRNRTLGQRAADFADAAGEGVAGVKDMVVGFGKGVLESLRDPEANDPLVSVVEGVARGTVRDAGLVRDVFDNVLKSDEALETAKEQFFTTKLAEWRGGAGLRDAGTLASYPDKATQKQWEAEFDRDVASKFRYEKFISARQDDLAAAAQSGSRKSIMTGEAAPINPGVAEGTSLVASPMAVVPFGKAMTPAKTLTRAVAAKTLQGAGRTFEWVGEKTVQAATLPERAAGAAAKLVSGTDEAAAKATQTVAQGVAGVSFAPVKAAGKTISAGGEAAEAVGRSAAAGPSRYGVFDRIAKDAKAPEWLRRAASAARPLDPAATMTGAAIKGASEGATIGTVLGAAADGEEGAAAGFGAGAAIGAGGGLAGRIIGAGRYNEGLKERDLAAWLASKSADEVANIANLKLSRDQALNLADTERLAKGASGDVEFRYVTDKEFTQLFGVGKGAQVLNGDRPVVFINTGYKGGRSMFHETMHALDALEGFAPQRQQLNRVLFDQTLADGQVVSKGLYSAADLAEFTSQYRSRLNEAARAEFDLLTPEERTARIMSEVRSESFANLVNGQQGGASVLATRGMRRRVADALLVAEADSMLGRMRRSLESVGVKFNASGDPSELFVRNGKPITNTPAVDAALRDYVRAKDNYTRKLVAGDDGEATGVVVRPEDLARTPALAETFKDYDIFARNPDGSVKVTVRPEEVARIETQEQVAIKAARDAEAVAETARQSAEAAQRAIAEAEARALAAEQIAQQSKNREAVAQAKADKVRWRETLRRGQEQLKTARAQEKAAREQAAAAKAKSIQLKNAKLSAGVPVLLSEREIRAVQARRVEAMIEALTKVPNLGEVDTVRLKPNGSWEGRAFSDKQLAALEALPDDVLSPSMKAKLRQLNELARQDGQQIILDYNAALKGGKYSSGIAPSTRAVVPLTFNISQAGNFFMTTLDTTHFFRKLGQWRKSKPRAFEAWNGDMDAFLRDAFTYLDNHVNGRSGAVNLDADAAVAVHKKNVINDFFNVPKGVGNEDANPVQLSTRGNKDNLIRSRRFDRINRITPGAGDKFPIRYELQKANYLPAAAQPTSATTPKAGSVRSTRAVAGISPVAIHKQLRAQAQFDLAAKSPGPANLNEWLAAAYLDVLEAKLNRGNTQTRTEQLQRIKGVADNTSAAEMSTAFAALVTGGQKGAKAHLERLVAMKTLQQ